jgi:predicted nucleotidyltransferase
VGITKDTEIEALLDRLADEIRHNTNGSLVGLYVYGSLVAGDFDKSRSDIDLLAVLDSDIGDETFGRLERMHARFVWDHPACEDRIEVAYVPAYALRDFRTTISQIAVISPGEPFHLKPAGKDWVLNWYVVREAGVTLYGPPPGTLIRTSHAPSSSRRYGRRPRPGKSGYIGCARRARSPTLCSPCAGRCTRIRTAGKYRKSGPDCGRRLICHSGHL